MLLFVPLILASRLACGLGRSERWASQRSGRPGYIMRERISAQISQTRGQGHANVGKRARLCGSASVCSYHDA